jgi:transcriptional regulator NrdR family protein
MRRSTWRFCTSPGKTGAKRSYSRSQLFSSLVDAFSSSPPKAGTIDAITDTVEAKILDLQQPEISTAKIASIVLTTLKHFSTPAFLRYLTSHTDLASSTQLKRELKKY